MGSLKEITSNIKESAKKTGYGPDKKSHPTGIVLNEASLEGFTLEEVLGALNRGLIVIFTGRKWTGKHISPQDMPDGIRELAQNDVELKGLLNLYCFYPPNKSKITKTT